MNCKKVYRIQNKDGKGPYVYTVNRSWETKNHNNNSLTPSPKEDGIFDFTFKYKFGFTTLIQLHNWFSDKELDNLSNSGFTVHEIKAEKIIEGNKQIAFIPTLLERSK